MSTDYTVLLAAMAMSFIVGMVIYLLWKVFESAAEGESRSLTDTVGKPAAVMAIGVTYLGVCMVFPQVLAWTFGGLAVVGLVSFIRISPQERKAIAAARNQADPQAKRSFYRLLLAVLMVFGVLLGLLVYFTPD